MCSIVTAKVQLAVYDSFVRRCVLCFQTANAFQYYSLWTKFYLYKHSSIVDMSITGQKFLQKCCCHFD